MGLTLALASVTTASPNLWAVNADTFGPEYNLDYVGGIAGHPDLYGRLHSPTGYDPEEATRYPLIIFFHGLGETVANSTPENINRSQVNSNMDGLYNNTKDDAFIYAPQAHGTSWNGGNIANAWAAIAKIISEYKVDVDRIYVTGLSLGGGATWASLMHYPVQAAGVPICGIDSQASGNMAELVGVPIWLFHVNGDPTVGAGVSRTNINQIRAEESPPLPAISWPVSTYAPFPSTDGTRHFQDALRPDLRYSEYPKASTVSTYHPPGTGTGTGDHAFAWRRAYHDTEPGNVGMLYDWMFSKSKTVEPLQAGETVLLDLGNHVISGADTQGRKADSTGALWNSTAGTGPEKSLNLPIKPGLLRTSEGRQTHVSAVVTDVFGGYSAGVSTTDPLLYDDAVSRDSWVTPANAASSLKFKGLTSGAHYKVSTFSRVGDTDGSYGRNMRLSIGSQVVEFTTAQVVNNVDTQAVFNVVQADVDGCITLSVEPINGSRRAMVNAVEITRLDDELPTWFSQAFSGSTSVANYTSTSLAENLFSDISAEADGGSWSINGGQLTLVKPGIGASTNGAGFTRYAVPVGDAPDVLEYSFKMSLTGVSGYMEIGVLDVGHMNAFQDYNNTTPSVATTNRLAFKAGGTNQYKFVLNTTTTGNYPADGSEVNVSWMLNQSGSTQTYVGYDSAVHSLDSGSSDLWVGETKALSNVPKNSAWTGTKFGAFRCRIGASIPITFTFDDFLLYDSLPQ